MKTGDKPSSTNKPLLLTKRIEEMLRAFYFYRYMTALDVAQLLYSPKIITYIRGILSTLAGGEDFQTHQYLYRFQLPSTSSGRKENIFTLGSRGRDFLASQLGLPVDWYYRPDRLRHLSHSHIAHHVTLTRFLVAASVWAAGKDNFRLSQTRTGFELARAPATVTLTSAGKKQTVKVVPDAWLLFERLKGEEVERTFPILLEIDRGSEYSQRFKQQVRARIEYIKKGGAYSKLFGTEAVIVAYATTGERPEYAQTRQQTLCTWTKEVLDELGKKTWAGVFRFYRLNYKDLYQNPMFESRVWYRPDSDKPVTLFPT